MENITDSNLVAIAKKIPYEKRVSFIRALNEPARLTPYLTRLFGILQPDYYVENTHGIDELGKDIVIIKQDNITLDIIGVIVVRGDIKGTTLGDVDRLINTIESNFTKAEERLADKIISQVRQTLDTGADLSGILENLPINRIIVVIAGEISPNAKTRIRKQIKEPVDFKDIRWLVDNFSDHYPQVFLQPDTIDFINDKIKVFNQNQTQEKDGLVLSDYFVDPLISTVELPERIEDLDKSLDTLSKKHPFSQLNQLIKENKKILLVGEPGTGKTGAIHKFALDILAESYKRATGPADENRCRIPVIVRAREFYTIKTADDLLEYFCGKLLERQNPEIVVILIDGIDEIPPLFRDDILSTSSAIAEKLKCPLVITSRKIDYVDTVPEGFKKVEVLPFELRQALQLFERLMGPSKALKSLKEELERVSHLIPLVPLSLHLLVKIVEEHNEIPSSITELYDRYMDAVLGRYDREKGIEVLYEYRIKKRFLAALAYHEFLMRAESSSPNPTEISKAQFDAFTSAHASKFGYDSDKLDEFIQEIERAGIIIINDRIIKFSHRSFLDYFVAWYINDNNEEFANLPQTIVDLYFDEVWTDVAFYYVGLRSKLSQTLLDKIFEKKSKSFSDKLQKYMVGRLLQAGWLSETKTKADGVTKAISLGGDVHEDLKAAFSQHQSGKISTLIPDIIFLGFSEMSFRSGVLSKELRSAYDQITTSSLNDLYRKIILLWCFYPFVESLGDRETILEEFMASVSSSGILQADKARMFLLINLLTKDESGNIKKLVDRYVQRVMKKNPTVGKMLLPIPKGSALEKAVRNRKRHKK